jgi:hypothetical protein
MFPASAPRGHLFLRSVKSAYVRYWHLADNRGAATFCPLLDKSGQISGAGEKSVDDGTV